MRILLTNDDGIHAPGLAALADALPALGEVLTVAPALNQSGVSHTITYLQPLMVREEFRDGRHFGWAVAGSPADCVKLAMLQLSLHSLDLVVSGINSGPNVGINVLYSGTVAAAIEGAFFGVTSVAVSLALAEQPDYPQAARLAVDLIAQLLEQAPRGSLWNLNLPETRADWPLGLRVLPMGLERYRETMEKRTDPRGNAYYWSGIDTTQDQRLEADTDVEALAEGYATLTPLQFNLTDRRQLEIAAARRWRLRGAAD